MYVYIMATIISVFFAYMSFKNKNKIPKMIFAILSFFPLFIVAAIRYDVGTDYSYTYTTRFLWRATQGKDLSPLFEVGFISLIDLILLFTKNPQWLFVVCAFIFSAFTFIAIYEQSNKPAYSILLLVIGCHYFISLNLVRNFVALAIALYAFKYIKQRKLILYSVFMILAATFHSSIVILYPIYFLYNKNKCGIKTTVIVIIGTICFLPLINIFLRYVIQFTSYAFYYESEKYGETTFLKTLFVVNMILLLVFLKNYKENENDKLYNLYIKIQLISILIAIIGGVMPMARRLILNFNFIQILSIPYIVNLEKNARYRLVTNIIIILLLSIYTFREIVILGSHGVLPYQTIFNI